MAEWVFEAYDNGGKHQVFRMKATDKTEAIRKGFNKANKNAAGDIHKWDCKLVQA